MTARTDDELRGAVARMAHGYALIPSNSKADYMMDVRAADYEIIRDELPRLLDRVAAAERDAARWQATRIAPEWGSPGHQEWCYLIEAMDDLEVTGEEIDVLVDGLIAALAAKERP